MVISVGTRDLGILRENKVARPWAVESSWLAALLAVGGMAALIGTVVSPRVFLNGFPREAGAQRLLAGLP